MNRGKRGICISDSFCFDPYLNGSQLVKIRIFSNRGNLLKVDCILKGIFQGRKQDFRISSPMSKNKDDGKNVAVCPFTIRKSAKYVCVYQIFLISGSVLISKKKKKYIYIYRERETTIQHMQSQPRNVSHFSQGLADNTVVGKVNGVVWDLDRPFEEDSTLQLLKFDDPDGKTTFLLTTIFLRS